MTDCQRKSQSVSTELEINFHRYILKTCCNQPVKHHHYELREQAEGLLLSWECRQPKGNFVIENTAGVCAPLKAVPGEFPRIHSNLCPTGEQSDLGQWTALAGKLNSQTQGLLARFLPSILLLGSEVLEGSWHGKNYEVNVHLVRKSAFLQMSQKTFVSIFIIMIHTHCKKLNSYKMESSEGSACKHRISSKAIQFL